MFTQIKPNNNQSRRAAETVTKPVFLISKDSIPFHQTQNLVDSSMDDPYGIAIGANGAPVAVAFSNVDFATVAADKENVATGKRHVEEKLLLDFRVLGEIQRLTRTHTMQIEDQSGTVVALRGKVDTQNSELGALRRDVGGDRMKSSVLEKTVKKQVRIVGISCSSGVFSLYLDACLSPIHFSFLFCRVRPSLR